jgi:protoporphyrinogen oxidase
MRAVVIAYVLVSRDVVGQADTYYFPEARFPFNRVMEQKQFSRALVPGNRTVLVMDLPCDPDDERFAAPDETVLAEIAPALEAAKLADRREITACWTVRFRSAYPIYELDTAARLTAAHAWADGVDNLWLAGRQGLFLHNNTHHSLLMGYRAAAAIQAGADRADWLREVASFADFTVAD